MSNRKSLELFISYSHRDDALRQRLAVFLRPLERDGIINCWHDGRIEAGEQFDKEIGDRLERADILLLLISADFLASDYCYSKEMSRALKRHNNGEQARVIPVILKPCHWENSPFKTLRVLPKDGKPVSTWQCLGSA